MTTSAQAKSADKPGFLVYYIAAAEFLVLGMRQTYTVPFTFGFSLGQFLLMIASVLWALTWLAGQRYTLEPHVLIAAMLTYLLSLVLSYTAEKADGFRFTPDDNSDLALLTDLRLVILAVFLLTVIGTSRDLDIVVKGLILGGTLSSLTALIMYATGVDLAPMFRLPGLKFSDFTLVRHLMRGDVIRMQGSAGHPLELGGVLTVLWPLSIGVALSNRRRKARSWPWALCAATIFAGMLVSVSRSAIVGGTVALLVMAWRWPLGRVLAAAGAAMMAVVLTAVISPGVYDAFLKAFTGTQNDPSFESRAIGVQFVLNNFTKTLWFGRGIGTWNLWVLDNQYLSRLIEAGVIGLGAYIIVLAVPLALALRASRRAPPELSDLIRGIAAALSAVMVINLVLDTAAFPQIWTLTWILIAFAGISWRLFPPKVALARVQDGQADRPVS